MCGGRAFGSRIQSAILPLPTHRHIPNAVNRSVRLTSVGGIVVQLFGSGRSSSPAAGSRVVAAHRVPSGARPKRHTSSDKAVESSLAVSSMVSHSRNLRSVSGLMPGSPRHRPALTWRTSTTRSSGLAGGQRDLCGCRLLPSCLGACARARPHTRHVERSCVRQPSL